MTITPSALDQLLLDLFTTALEGGIGYWSQASTYRWSTGDSKTGDRTGFKAEIIVDEGDEDATYVIDRSVMAKGYRLATTDWAHRIAWSSGQRPPLVVGPDTDWDFDASDADVIVQLGLFEELVYARVSITNVERCQWQECTNAALPNLPPGQGVCADHLDEATAYLNDLTKRTIKATKDLRRTTPADAVPLWRKPGRWVPVILFVIWFLMSIRYTTTAFMFVIFLPIAWWGHQWGMPRTDNKHRNFSRWSGTPPQ